MQNYDYSPMDQRSKKMSKTLTFTIPGVPKGKGRPRISVRGGFARAYTPAATRSYEAEMSWYANQAGASISESPCTMHIEAIFPIPASFSKKKKEEALSGALRYTKKPDCDNISKMKDALNQIAFRDDSQVYQETVLKRYGAEPCLIITIIYDN